MASSNNLDALFADGELPFGPGDGHLFMEQNALHGSQDELPAILDFQARWPWAVSPVGAPGGCALAVGVGPEK